MFLTMTVDIQLLLGLPLYLVLSPVTTLAMKNFGAAMKNPQLRFWAVEHLAMMMLAVILVHVGRVLARKAPTPEPRMRWRCVSGLRRWRCCQMPWPDFHRAAALSLLNFHRLDSVGDCFRAATLRTLTSSEGRPRPLVWRNRW